MKKKKFAEEDRIANAQRAGCVVIILVVVAIIAFLGVRVYEVYFKPTYPLMPDGFQLYDTDTISTRDSVEKEMPKEEPKVTLPTSSSSSSGKSSYKHNDNMRGFDPPSEDDMDDNGMSRYMNAYDDEDWY